MTYKKEDWYTARRRLEQARAIYEHYKDPSRDSPDPDELDLAVWNAWTFGEYAVNVVIECLGMDVPQNHTQWLKAKDLFTSKQLVQDYSTTLELMERFRKKASHLGYAKERSTHYSSADMLRCLVHMEALCEEVEAKLRERRKL